MIKTLPLDEARPNLNKLIKHLQKGQDDYVLTVDGQPAIRISALNKEEYESWKETQEILNDPQAMADIKAGRVHEWETVRKELGWDV